jgi:3-oxoacyl-[acyl-carrier protein] reductase
MPDTDKRIVWVTGGSRGIGRAICMAFAGANTHVYFNFSAASDAAAVTEKQVAEAGGTATGVQVDVASEKEVSEFVGRILDESGRIDVLVNNAAITRDGLIVRMKSSDWDDVMDTNLKGAFNCIKAVTKPMLRPNRCSGSAPVGLSMYLPSSVSAVIRARPIMWLPKPALSVLPKQWPRRSLRGV